MRAESLRRAAWHLRSRQPFSCGRVARQQQLRQADILWSWRLRRYSSARQPVQLIRRFRRGAIRIQLQQDDRRASSQTGALVIDVDCGGGSAIGIRAWLRSFHQASDLADHSRRQSAAPSRGRQAPIQARCKQQRMSPHGVTSAQQTASCLCSRRRKSRLRHHLAFTRPYAHKSR